MPRPKFKRVPCDCLDCREEGLQPINVEAAVAASSASARQDPPPKCLIVFADRFLQADSSTGNTSLSSAECPHLHGVARDGSSGLLALRQSAPGSQSEATLNTLSQLLEAEQATVNGGKPATLAERYKHLSATLLTNSPAARAWGSAAGFAQSCHLANLVPPSAEEDGPSEGLRLLPADAVASRAMQILGVGGAETAGQPCGSLPPPGGQVIAPSADDFPSIVRPKQSYQICGLDEVQVQQDRPLLTVQRLPGVIRRDHATKLGLQECLQHGGNQCILAERLLPELAYKLGRAPKYGA
ncbi:hypothetical protein WJX72_004744 [[Myrmecia] bisecta]|uniref:Uncharacterized protein n=1 Tax=[Myrmecia] bisecta TaxID=41462 RepID=A0AAW1QQG6_9CHLO